MIVVCNSSTLIALARINSLDILEKVVKKLTIPPAVYEEIVIKEAGRPGSMEIKKAQWINKVNVLDHESVINLTNNLGVGESEAIALAKEIKADLIILDDDKARKMAISKGLKATGFLALLIQAKEKGFIKEVKPIMNKLKQQEFFIGKDLHVDVIQKAGE